LGRVKKIKLKDNSTLKIGDLILYKNNQLIAFNKPSALPVQADRTEDKALLDLAEIYCQSKVYLVHRLDRPASGVVLMAKHKKAVAAMNQQFQEQKPEKIYFAIVKNKPEKDSGTLVHFLKKNGKTNLSKVVEEGIQGAKRAELTYEILGSIDNYHLLKVKLITGRHHQIRVQLAAAGSPIKGDVKYGFRRGNRDRSIDLHARSLAFSHPISKEKVELIADCPQGGVWDAFREKGVI